MRCQVLTYAQYGPVVGRGAISAYALAPTDLGYGATRTPSASTSTWQSSGTARPSVLCTCDGISGTDIGYAATRHQQHLVLLVLLLVCQYWVLARKRPVLRAFKPGSRPYLLSGVRYWLNDCYLLCGARYCPSEASPISYLSCMHALVGVRY
eukprot:3940590-Rhodomonas_salina.4